MCGRRCCVVAVSLLSCENFYDNKHKAACANSVAQHRDRVNKSTQQSLGFARGQGSRPPDAIGLSVRHRRLSLPFVFVRSLPFPAGQPRRSSHSAEASRPLSVRCPVGASSAASPGAIRLPGGCAPPPYLSLCRSVALPASRLCACVCLSVLRVRASLRATPPHRPAAAPTLSSPPPPLHRRRHRETCHMPPSPFSASPSPHTLDRRRHLSLARPPTTPLAHSTDEPSLITRPSPSPKRPTTSWRRRSAA